MGFAITSGSLTISESNVFNSMVHTTVAVILLATSPVSQIRLLLSSVLLLQACKTHKFAFWYRVGFLLLMPLMLICVVFDRMCLHRFPVSSIQKMGYTLGLVYVQYF